MRIQLPEIRPQHTPGRLLVAFASNRHLPLINDPTTSTRTGTAKKRHLARSSMHTRNKQTFVIVYTSPLSSDHCIIRIHRVLNGRIKRTYGNYTNVKIRDWDKTRLVLRIRNDHESAPESWSKNIIEVIINNTKTITRTEDHPHVDNHVLTLRSKRGKSTLNQQNGNTNSKLAELCPRTLSGI